MSVSFVSSRRTLFSISACCLSFAISTAQIRENAVQVPTGTSNAVLGHLSINDLVGGAFSTGQPWKLTLTGGPANTQFAFCAAKGQDPATCIPTFGTTDQNGSWTVNGSFDLWAIGAWTEWVQFPSTGTTNVISFTVSVTTLGTLKIDNMFGETAAVGDPWTLILSEGPANSAFAVCSSRNGAPATCARNFGTTDGSGSWTLTGRFDENVAGRWTEWLEFPSGTTSNRITFVVGTVVVNPLFGVSFIPFEADQDPSTSEVMISEEQIRTHLSAIAPFSQAVLTYSSTHGFENTPRLARTMGLTTAIGAKITADLGANELEIANLIAAIKQGHVDIAVVGYEAIGTISEDRLIAYMNEIRQAAPPSVKVTTTISYWNILTFRKVANACDIIFLGFPGLYAFGWDPDTAMSQLIHFDEQVRQYYTGKEVVIADIGWPSTYLLRSATVGPENQRYFFNAFVAWARNTNRKYFWFEAVDQPWQTSRLSYPAGFGDETEPTFGIWTQSGSMKSGMADVFGANATDPIGGPGTPSITFTYTPPRRTAGTLTNVSDTILGQVSHVLPFKFYVSVYIRVNGLWWGPKPFWSQPLVTINYDGKWACNINTGGVDTEADLIAAYVLPIGFTPPAVAGSSTLPNDLPSRAVATLMVTR